MEQPVEVKTEPTWAAKAQAFLSKIANAVIDPRTISAILSILTVLHMLGVVQDELTEEHIVAVLGATNATLLGLVALIGALAAIVTIVKTWTNAWTIRPSRGLEPFLPKK